MYNPHSGIYILENTPLGGISADVIWGKYKRVREKRGKCKRKRKKWERKWKKGERKRENGKYKGKINAK